MVKIWQFHRLQPNTFVVAFMQGLTFLFKRDQRPVVRANGLELSVALDGQIKCT